MSRAKSRTGIDTASEIRRAREALDLTQEEFARKLEVASSSVQNWESGRSRPSRKSLRKIRALAGGPASPEKRASRISEDTRMQLQAALDCILERAPSTVITKVAEFLTHHAGRYGNPKE